MLSITSLDIIKVVMNFHFILFYCNLFYISHHCYIWLPLLPVVITVPYGPRIVLQGVSQVITNDFKNANENCSVNIRNSWDAITHVASKGLTIYIWNHDKLGA